MIDYTNSNIEKVSVHNVGNRINDEKLKLSKSVLDISDGKVRELLFKFFFTPFTSPEFYSFTFTNEDFRLNPMFSFASDFFDNQRGFHKSSVNVAKHIYEISSHPNIKSGDLFITYVSGISIDGETTDAIGVFKSESKQPFLKLDSRQESFSIQYDDGINVDKLDKGCLIFNTGKSSGFKICIVDKSNKSEAQYWKDDFLRIKPLNDNYHLTNNFLKLSREFIMDKMPSEFEVDKTEQIDYLNRTVEYFKTHDVLNKKEFENEVFYHPEVVKSFKSFERDYQNDKKVSFSDNFEILPHVVKKQAKAFKSVLKLDKNFHIYIHGDKELIEKGFDKEKNLNYYKVYFKEEL